MGRTHLLERAQLLPYPLEHVFDFFADAGNLEAITPPSLHFQIDTPLPIEMGVGTLIDYRLRLLGIPFRWRTRIDVWEPPHRFVDLQLRGPYSLWRHTHEFHQTEQGVLMIDRVEYRIPYWIFGGVAHAIYVHRALDHIFDHRRQTTERLLAEQINHSAERTTDAP